MRGYGSASYGEGMADVYDEWYADVTDAEATVERIAALAAPDGAVLELGVGTGRLALPLAARHPGPVWGLDASPAMLDRLAAKDPGGRVQRVLADMAEPPAGPFRVVFAAYNTLFSLPSHDHVADTVAAVAAVLEPGGSFVVEAFVPGPAVTGDGDDGPGSGVDGPTSGVDVRRLDADRVVLSVFRTDPAAGRAEGSFVELRDGEPVRLRPWLVHFRTPEALDALAATAGLDLVERHAGWRSEPFGEASAVHVTRYRRRSR